MDTTRLAYLAAAVIVGVIAVELAWRALARSWRRARARRRYRRGERGERRAERLLDRLGYAICERQAATSWTIHCDRAPYQVPLRADLIVERGGRRYVAEVKTGRAAPRLETASTRRQLLEYRVAYDVAGVLLVDAEAERVMEIEFPLPAPPARLFSRERLVGTVWGLCVGALLGLWAAQLP